MVQFVRKEKNLSDDWVMYGWEITDTDSLKITLYNKHFPYEDFDRVVVVVDDVDTFINT